MSIFSDISTQSERNLVSDWGQGKASDSDILARFRQLALPLAVAACGVAGFGLAAVFAQKNHQPHDAKLFGGAAGILALAASPFARKIRTISPAWHAVQIHNRLTDVSHDFYRTESRLKKAQANAPDQPHSALTSEHADTATTLKTVEGEYVRLIRNAGVHAVPNTYRNIYDQLR